MAIKLQNARKSDFNSTAMSDLVFLLLIFFMITSTLVSPNVINILLPKSDSGQQSTNRNIEVYINEAKEYFVNPQGSNAEPVVYEELLPLLQEAVANDQSDQQAIILRSDKSVPIENVVILMDVLNDLNETLEEGHRYKIVLATEAQ
ncbi:biopolymer transporter ExbD [Bacteroidales bacterium OttesenSCG-928-B11]|nr:biopolymer transporter ExbD [Bacteroidales bacterium OttesenSCG-928-B11]MDL2326367.1 biopolymer transporter ExbD [Bacteroidales bacterium OttesenSCG-928-A14]